jgi:4-alpha-glucanotransferase
MKICFTVLCRTEWGQNVYVLGSAPELGIWDPERAVEMVYTPGDLWKAELSFPLDEHPRFKYRYILKDDAGTILHEELAVRRSPVLAVPLEDVACVEFSDTWSSPSDPGTVFLTAPFTTTIFAESSSGTPVGDFGEGLSGKTGTTVRLQLINRRVARTDRVYVTGSIPDLGGGNIEKARPMDHGQFPLWRLDLHLDKGDTTFSYRYLIKDRGGNIVAHEDEDRTFHLASENVIAAAAGPKRVIVVTDNKFAYESEWRGAGIALPVFSIRSEKGLGVGEFLDLKGLADWAHDVGFRIIQMLPVNDTSSTKEGTDFCPYSCISIFALHPIYLNLEAIGSLPDDILLEMERQRTRLNRYPTLKHREVMAVKLALLRKIFNAGKDSFLSSLEFQAFLEEHGHWLRPYAAFCVLRDQYGTSDFRAWDGHSLGTEGEISALTAPGSTYYDAVAFYYFVQYHLHLQLSEASQYAREKGVVLKGDIPIGVQKGSDSCWANPELFHMDQSTGAPPDPFSDSGQNWGFPTYNWKEMASNNYSWWRRRLGHMSHYFQVVRLDHILGFFRIWEIPDHATSALLGHFSPALPLTRDELERQGIWDFDRICEPYITESLVAELFGADAERVTEEFLDRHTEDRYRMKSAFATQRLVEIHLPSVRDGRERWKHGLLTLISNIVLFRDPSGKKFHPRINALDTASFDALDGWEKDVLTRLYYDYFYHRQEPFWREQGMVKLPVLKKVSNMLICGEDLGMIPDCVPEAMEELCLLGLRIQRMPKEPNREFGIPAEYNYLTVCTTSSHDMSTLRGWWEEDSARAERYYHTVLGHKDEPPSSCEPAVCEEIIRQHLESPSMWAIFPIQDVLAMGKELQRPGDPREEQINNPADPFNQWGFRVHISLEDLMGKTGFNERLRQMVRDSGRISPY